MESSSSSGSSKRAKAPSNITHVVSCLVDGCNSDLSQCREYHRRHKVCELHSKTPKVTIGGREQRFCQQCSRFHSLVEFDEVKRSCRKRLDGHNRRRRKPQSESLSRNTGKFLSHQQGTTLLSFSNQQLLPIAMMDSSWAENGGVPYGSHQGLNYSYRHDNFPGSTAHSFGGGNQLSSVCQPPLLDPNSASGNSSHSPKVFSDGSSRVIDSDCALSLLSSARAETRKIGLSHMVLPNPIPNMHYSNLGQYSQGVESKPVISVLNSQGGNNASLHSQGMFQDGSPASGSHSHQALSFRWE